MAVNLGETIKTLIKEAQFTNEMLGEGATQIRRANYAAKGIYFQAFTALSTGLERIGKLCLMIDYYIKSGGNFPYLAYLKNQIGHKIDLIYRKSQLVVRERSLSFQIRSSKSLGPPPPYCTYRKQVRR